MQDHPNARDLVFPSSTGTLREVNNVERQWRDARSSEYLRGFSWVIWHTFRRTVATLIDRATGTEDAAAVLGHSGTAVTARHYVQRAAVAPDVSAALNALGVGRPIALPPITKGPHHPVSDGGLRFGAGTGSQFCESPSAIFRACLRTSR